MYKIGGGLMKHVPKFNFDCFPYVKQSKIRGLRIIKWKSVMAESKFLG